MDSPVRNPRVRSPKLEESPLTPRVPPLYTDTISDDNNPDLIPDAPNNGKFLMSSRSLGPLRMPRVRKYPVFINESKSITIAARIIRRRSLLSKWKDYFFFACTNEKMDGINRNIILCLLGNLDRYLLHIKFLSLQEINWKNIFLFVFLHG